jgi:hypothetical protein
MLESDFMKYIERFNNEDLTAFEDYLHPNMHMKNGMLEFDGIEGMKHHYRDLIWPDFKEHLIVPRFLSTDGRIAIQMRTLFTARHDNPNSLFGPVLEGEGFEFNGIIMYELEGGLFKDILVAYNSFVYTDIHGNQRDLGIPH